MSDNDGSPFYNAGLTPFGRALTLELADGVAHNTLRVGQYFNHTCTFRAFCGAEGKTGLRAAYPTCVACVGHVYKKSYPL